MAVPGAPAQQLGTAGSGPDRAWIPSGVISSMAGWKSPEVNGGFNRKNHLEMEVYS